MNRRQIISKIPLFAGGSLLMGGCSQEAIRRIEAETGPEGTGIQFSALPKVIKILATYTATPKQVAVAEEHARAAQVVLAKKPTPPPSTAGVKPSHSPAVKQKTKIIAVETVPDDRLKGSQVVMLWNTQTQQIVGNQAYDVQAVPKRGEVAVWGSITAQYVGDGKL